MKNRILPLLPLLLAVVLLLSACAPAPVPPAGTQGATSAETQAPTDAVTDAPADETCPDGKPHSDEDDDGTCDSCHETVLVMVDFFALNDLHGKFCDTDKQPGVDELSTYLKNAYLTEEAVVVLSSGDMWQGSSESNLTEGAILTDWMNEMDFVSMTLGNHEYDWGEDSIEANAAAAEFPFLAINVFDRGTGKPVAYCQPSVMVRRGGAKIGIIGAIGDCYSSISGETSGGVYFKVGDELTALIKAESERLRAEGADLIIYSLHDGFEDSRTSGFIPDDQISHYYDPALSEGYVDLVFEGHTHQKYALKDSKGVYHLQGGGENRGIAHAEVKVNIANGHYHVDSAEIVPASVYEKLTDHPIVAELLEKYGDKVSVGSEVLGINATRRSGDELRALVADLYYRAGAAKWGGTYDIVLGGGFISVRSPYELPAGEVTYSELQSLFPFDNELVLCSVKGRDLLSKFINTDNKNYFNCYGEYGESVKDDIDPDGTYYVIVDTYTSTYAPNRLTEVERYGEGVYARDLLADYIGSNGLG